jgi:hypothetical protein
MEQICSVEPNARSDGQEINHILWEPMVHYRIHNSRSLDHILSQINPIHSIPSHVSKVHDTHPRHSIFK